MEKNVGAHHLDYNILRTLDGEVMWEHEYIKDDGKKKASLFFHNRTWICCQRKLPALGN